MKASPLQDSFNAGEFSEITAARVRFEKYKNAVATCENMIPMVQGGLTRRTGTMFVAEVESGLYVADGYVNEGYVEESAKVRLVPFEYSVTQAYVLEFSNQKIRFYKDRGLILDGVTPYSISTPYDVDELFDIKFTQSKCLLERP